LMALGAWGTLHAQNKPFDAAAAFGARPNVLGVTLSPDGKQLAYIAPAKGRAATVVYTLNLEKESDRVAAMGTAGDELIRLIGCGWLSNDRLACEAYAITGDPKVGLLPTTRIFAVDASGANLRMMSTTANDYTRGYLNNGGQIIDWQPNQEGAVLMARHYRPDEHLGSRMGSTKTGLGVDLIDTRSLTITSVEPPDPIVSDYITDGRGTVRIMGISRPGPDGYATGLLEFLYREAESRTWHPLSRYSGVDGSGFAPLAIDPELNVAYGLKKLDGRLAVYSVKLDASLHEELVYARPDVDVTGVVRIGRQQRIVGASYVTDTPQIHYFEPQVEQLMSALHRALPNHALDIHGASSDGGKLLLLASSDSDPGVYYIFDRASHQLRPLLAVRSELAGVKLASAKPVSYPAADGVAIPAYLTLPPGRESAKGLPAIVMPHGGPSWRDSASFDWLAQFYAARGYAVLQPNYRGSSGYGDAWSERNGFKSWSVAIADVLAAGRWLVSQGIADPAKLAIVGWSYGGYAALQSAVVDQSTFKAVVAIAPVTDLAALKEEHRHWGNFDLVSDFVGSGASMHAGSPVEHADQIKVPVLLFHGTYDRNVGIDESKRMAARLKAAGKQCELVTWDKLDHQLDDSDARTEMLRKSDAFLRKAMGM